MIFCILALFAIYCFNYLTKTNENYKTNKSKTTGRILCFGDSLTAGYMDGGSKYWPYTNKLQKLLDDKYGPIYDVICRGYPGDTVTNDFKSKFSRDLKEENVPYLAVLLLGGTNDMAYGKSIDEITRSLDTLCMEAEETDAKVFVLSVPDCKHCTSRKDLNNKLRNSLFKKIVFLSISMMHYL